MKTTILRKRNSIVIQYRIDGKQFRVYTGVQCKAKTWNKKNKSLKGSSESSISANQLIKKYRNSIESFVNDLRRDGQPYDHNLMKTFIKKKFSKATEVAKEKDLFYAFKLFIDSKSKSYAPVTINSYKNSLSHLKKFSNNDEVLPFNKLNKLWFEKYVHFLKTELNHSPGTRSNQIKNIKSVLNFAHELELHNYTKYQSIKKERPIISNVYLTESEIDLLSTTHFKYKCDEKVIDAFIFICLTGLRFTDYSKISDSNFNQVDNHWFIHFKQAKTKREVTVPIVYKKACDLILKYNFQLPKYSNAYFNRRVKSILEAENLLSEKVTLNKENFNGQFLKRKLITIHTGRRTFATNLYLKNTPINLIMAATGHKTEKAFRTYIKASEIEKSKGLIHYADY